MTLSLSQSLPRVIPLNVGGCSFVTTLSTLTKDKDSMLAAMFSGRHELDTDSEGRYFIDRDGTYFKYILNYLRDRKQLPSADIALEVRLDPSIMMITVFLFRGGMDISSSSSFRVFPGQTIATCQPNILQHCWAQHVAFVGHRVAMLHLLGQVFN